ncbi:MAG TPA: biotin-dependent carboxyltransferase family protein, partial [Candidatus Limnocylindria bacterium]|nr:biotin-dependent carboxyltransferase family protein [Candidatus Limnocylindria bacterium]
RAYLAFAGGLEVKPVLGSRSTDLRSRFGGVEGRALRAGDRLALAPSEGAAAGWLSPTLRRTAIAHVAPEAPLPILPGRHLGHFTADAFQLLCDSRWRVSRDADRAGIRLDGPPLHHVGQPEVPSVGLPLGAVQVPRDGRPIVMLVDRPVTGGYPVVGCLGRAAVGRAAQLLPGDEVRFAPVTAAQAREELRNLDALLRDGVRSQDDPGPAWAGALD